MMKKIIWKNIGIYIVMFANGLSCQPKEWVYDLPTQICMRTQHHHQPIPHATIYVKFNTDNFPGYDAPPSFYDRQFKTDKNARGCLKAVPEGRHWLVAFGYDSLYYPHDVFGSMQVDISLSGKASIDTIFYLSE